MGKLILIRHCETDYAKKKIYCGHRDIPLNMKGVAEARRLAIKLKDLKVDKVYSSDLKRAFQTANIIFKGIPITKRKALREIDFGRLTGMTHKQAASAYPDIYGRWLNDPSLIRMPGGESLRDFEKRVTGCFERIVSAGSNKTTAVVCHEGVMRVILLERLGLGLGKLWDIKL